MEKTPKYLFFLLALIVLFSSVEMAHADVPTGTTQNEIGMVSNYDGSVPADADIRFTAFIVGREGEILSESSPGNGYSSGYYQVNVGNFPTAWSVGDTLRINFTNVANSEAGSIDIVLESIGHVPLNGNQVDVVLISSVCIVSLSVQGSPFGGMGFTGEKLTVQVNPADRVAGIAFDLTFNPQLLSVSGAALSDSTQGWSVTTDTSVAGRVSVDMSGPDATPLAPGSNVAVLDVLFDVDAAAPAGYTGISFFNLFLVNDLGQPMTSCSDTGQFYVCRKGDADADDTLDILDIIKILRVVVLFDPQPGILDEQCRNDLNNDGVVDILDVVLAVKASGAP